MSNNEPTLEQLNEDLEKATKILNNCAGMIRDIPLNPTNSKIRNIGYAISYIFDIQQEIYKLKPELTPQYLLEPVPDPEFNSALNKVYKEVFKYEDSCEYQKAIEAFTSFLATNPPARYANIAKSEILRFQEKLNNTLP